MIEVTNISKSFDDIKAVDHVTVEIQEGSVFGFVGTNGAGKSTLLRMLSGIIKPDGGVIKIDGMEIFENTMAKELMFYISDNQYYFNNAAPKDMKKFYQVIYPNFDRERFDNLMNQFELPQNRKINTFSKGMKKQLSVIIGICANTKYLFCDETFDGLDPVVRQAVKSIIAKEIADRNMTTIIASHNLRELEDICDHVGLLHRGGILFSRDLYDMKLNIHKIQCVFNNEDDPSKVFESLDIIKQEQRGSLYTISVRGNREEIAGVFEEMEPIYFEILPLSLEEVFICETEVVGYDIKKLIS